MLYSGCGHAMALGRGVKVLSLLASVPFLRILLISLKLMPPETYLHLFWQVPITR